MKIHIMRESLTQHFGSAERPLRFARAIRSGGCVRLWCMRLGECAAHAAHSKARQAEESLERSWAFAEFLLNLSKDSER